MMMKDMPKVMNEGYVIVQEDMMLVIHKTKPNDILWVIYDQT